jgi:dipeptidyl aminopeptidase/acylaminoacyl peptidase
VKWTITLIAIIAVLVAGTTLNLSASASDRWHVEVTRPVDAQEIQFTNGSAHLVGTVYLPRTGNHLSAVVVLHDASMPTRESALYRHLREGLPALGFAVLVYDRRGTGESSGDRNVDYETLADDAIAGQQALARLPRIDPARIGFWGLSQGGWLAVLAAGRSQEAAFAISVSAPLVTADEQMQFATSNLLIVRGYSPSDVREMLEARRAWTGYLRGTKSHDVAVDALRRSESKPWFDISYLPSASRLTADPEHDPTRRTLDDDPVAAVRRAHVPLLFLYGDSDPWVPVAQSIERLQSLTRELHNIEYAVVPGANHEIMSLANETMQIDQNTIRNDEPQAPTYFILLGSWLSRWIPK